MFQTRLILLFYMSLNSTRVHSISNVSRSEELHTWMDERN